MEIEFEKCARGHYKSVDHIGGVRMSIKRNYYGLWDIWHDNIGAPAWAKNIATLSEAKQKLREYFAE